MKKTLFIISLFVIIVVSCIFFNRRGIRYFYESFMDYPEIDMVYTWVDYNDLKKDAKDIKLEYKRYVQNEELRYSLRSVEKNCPWIRNIYIVVKDGQRPDFIVFSDKIKLVNHSEIMPHSSLPSYNSIAIESCIHKIRGLSDYYIYMNDDFFIMKPLYKTDVLSEKADNRKYVPYVDEAKPNSYKLEMKDINGEHSYWTMFNNSLSLANKMTGKNLIYNMVHLPAFCYKPWEKDIENKLKSIKYNKNGSNNLWDYNVHCKFRMNDSVAINCCSRPIYYMENGAIPINLAQYHMTFNLKKDTCNADGYDLSKVKFLCINEIDDECKDNFKKFIKSYFPKKSSFEV